MVHNKNYKGLKSQAINFRLKGWSYKEIQKEVRVAKSTLSLWLKNIPLKPEHRQRLYTKQVLILSRGAQSQKERRKREIAEIVAEAEKEIQLPLPEEVYRFFGAALYWAEGSKTRGFEITNSDPHLILFIVGWVKNVFDLNPKDLKARLNIYSQQNDGEIKKFWSELTGIPLENFGKSYIKPSGKGYKKNNLYYGTMRIEVPRGTDLRHRVFGWIKAILQNVNSDVELTQKKWASLTKILRPVNIPPIT